MIKEEMRKELKEIEKEIDRIETMTWEMINEERKITSQTGEPVRLSSEYYDYMDILNSYILKRNHLEEELKLLP